MNRKTRIFIAGAVLMSAALVSGLSIYVRANALPAKKVIDVPGASVLPEERVLNVSVASVLPAERVIQIKAKKFDFTPDTITLKKGEPVVFEISSADRKHGFNLRAFGVRADVPPGGVSRVRFTPDKTGKFSFTCDVFCGDGHEDMTGTVVVTN